jgi:L-asparaginase
MTIAIVSTGGTISSTETEGEDASPELQSDDLVESVPELGDLTEIVTEDFATIVSHHYTIEQMYGLVERLRELDSDSDIDGIVVTQGTNTLEVVSYFADLCYGGETPVVFTGAMRNPSLTSPDGPGNLLTAVRTAMSDRAGEMGVLVAFNYRVHAARGVSKIHTTNPDTFRTPEYGPVGAVEEGRVRWHRRPLDRDPTFDPDPADLTGDVATVVVTADMTPRTLEAAGDSAAVCLGCMGAGHLTETIVPTLETLHSGGVPIVASTLSPEGHLLRDTYECYGCENTTRELCYYSDVNLRKTRIKTIVAIANDRLSDAFVPPEASPGRSDAPTS